MPKIIIEVNVPLEGCKTCRLFEIFEKHMYGGYSKEFSKYYCKYYSHCEHIVKAFKEKEMEDK